ncbi:DUF2341 domain-containing protein [Paenibacillus sp. MBLB4367]|uniref:DUF2341 domain-containing protein n=1 Tax=Paenibacillus sp. MBLB4367 TaxID=3384767 RepID=UPI003907EA16
MVGKWPMRKMFRKLQLFVCAILVLALLVPEAAAASAGQPEAGNASGAGAVQQSVYGSVYDSGPASSGLLPSAAGYTERDLNPETGQLGGFGYAYGFQLDYMYRSIGVDLGFRTTVNTIELDVKNEANRVEKVDLSLYVSDDNMTFLKVKDWDFVKVGGKAILYNFSEMARYVKVHNHFDDTTGTFYADNLQDMVKAYHLPPGRFTAGGGKSWLFRKPVTVANPNNETLYDRAVYLTKAELGTEELIAAGKLQADYRDVRFADAGGKELHYYMDDNGFFVRIPQLQASASETVYFVYGNPAASFRGHAQEALQVEYGNKTLVAQDGEIKPVRLKDGTLMMLAGSNDKGVTARYSYDGGKNWTNAEALVPAVSNSGMYQFPGGAYVDEETGDVYLFFGVHYYFGVWSGGSTCLDKSVCRNDMYFAKSSGFNGKKPVFGATRQITGINTASGHPIHYALSYTNPIRLSTGRLLEPFSYVIGDDGTFGVGILYSDDDGATWQKSVSELSIPSVGGEGGVTEVAIIELADGTVKTYMRQQRADLFYLGTSSSTDKGKIWSQVTNSEIMSTNTFPAMIRDGNKDILLTWSGHNAMGGSSYQRSNLTVAYSSDETASWQAYRDVLGRTRLSNPGWFNGNDARTVVQADKVPAGEDGWLFAWSGPNGVYSLLVEDFDRYLRRSHGALDDFEYEKPAAATDNGSRLAYDYWWKTTDSGVVATSDARVKQGKRSLHLNDTVNDKKRTAASRLFPAARKASVQFSVYGASFANELYVSLQEGFSQNWNALGAGFILQVSPDGKLKYTDTAADSSTSDTKVGFVNPDSDPTKGNLISIGDTGSFALDYVNRSVGADLGRLTKINGIKLTDSKQYNKPQAGGVLGNRVNKENLEVYISNSNKGDWTKVEGWSYNKTDGSITIGLEGLSVSARYVKVHQSFSDTAFTFGGPLQEIMTVVTDQSAPIVFHELPTPTVLAKNAWSAVKLDYDMDAGSAGVYVNGEFKGTIADAHPGRTINHLMLSSGTGMGTDVYIDEVIIQDKSLSLPLAGSVGAEEQGPEGKDAMPPTVSFQPDGNEAWLNGASPAVTVRDDWSGVDEAKLAYKWSQSEAIPGEGWEPFVNGAALIKANVSGDWYLHVRAADRAGNETVVHSKRFRLLSRTEWNPAAASIVLTIPGSVPPGQTAVLSGTVYDVRHAPLAGTTVFLTATKGVIASRAVTGGDGTFTAQFQAPVYGGEIVISAFVPGSTAFQTISTYLAAAGGGTDPVYTGNGGSGTSTPAPAPSVIIDVKPADLKAENGAVTLTLAAGKEGVSLPGNVADLIGKEASVVVQAGAMKLAIPADVLASAAALLPEGERKNGSIVVKAKPVTGSAHPDLAAGGQAYELTIEAIGMDGKALRLSSFAKPVTITISAPDVRNPKLAGIYYIDESGAFRLIGGTYGQGSYTAEVRHFSKYGVYAYTKSYLDVPESHWAHAVIQELSFKGIANGMTDKTFAPDQALTRAELTALLVRALGAKAETGAPQAKFQDVKNGDWYAEAVQTAHALGLVQGTSEGTFEPDRTVTREEMATMIVRAVEKQTGRTLPEADAAFADWIQVSAWAQPAVGKAFALKLIEGRTEGRFVPNGTATRAESAKLILLLGEQK